MKMKKKIIINVLFLLILFIGCSAMQVYTSSPVVQSVSSNYFEASLEPIIKVDEKFFNAFRLTIKNTSNQPVVIDWRRTRYIYNNKNAGGFHYDGLTPEKIKEPPPESIPPGVEFSKVISPVQLIGWEDLGQGQYIKAGETGYTRGIIPAGENGILLVVMVNGEVVREKLTLTIEMTEIKG
jgi:hypothetical protein